MFNQLLDIHKYIFLLFTLFNIVFELFQMYAILNLGCVLKNVNRPSMFRLKVKTIVSKMLLGGNPSTSAQDLGVPIMDVLWVERRTPGNQNMNNRQLHIPY